MLGEWRSVRRDFGGLLGVESSVPGVASLPRVNGVGGMESQECEIWGDWKSLERH